jgi:hypothetical protein
LGQVGTGIFFEKGLDSRTAEQPVGQITQCWSKVPPDSFEEAVPIFPSAAAWTHKRVAEFGLMRV